MKYIATILIILMLIVTACSNPRATNTGDVDLTMNVLSPEKVGPATIEVGLKDADGNAIDAADVKVIGDMTHAGMKAVHADAMSMGDGMYETSDFEFTMGGDWIITVEATLENGEMVEKNFPVNGVAGDSMDSMDHDDHMDHDSMEGDHMEGESMDHDAMEHGHSHDHAHEDQFNFEVPEGETVPTIALSVSEAEDHWVFNIDTNLELLSSEDGVHVDGQGHAHLYLDDQFHGMVYSDSFMLSDLTEDTVVKVVLTTNSHLEYEFDGELISDTIMIEVE